MISTDRLAAARRGAHCATSPVSWYWPIGTVWRRVEREAGAPPPSTLGQQRQVDAGADPDGDHRRAGVAVVRARPQVTRTVPTCAVDALVGERLPRRRLGPRPPVGVVGRERVGAAGRPRRGADPEGAALHLEDREHDPDHRDQQQDARARQTSTRALPRSSRSARASRRCSSTAWPVTVELDRRAAEPERGTSRVTVTSTPGAPSTSTGVGRRRPGRTGRRSRRRSARGSARPRRRVAVDGGGVPGTLGGGRRPGCCARAAPARPGGCRGTAGPARPGPARSRRRRAALAPAPRRAASGLACTELSASREQRRELARRRNAPDDHHQAGGHHRDQHPARARRRARRARAATRARDEHELRESCVHGFPVGCRTPRWGRTGALRAWSG